MGAGGQQIMVQFGVTQGMQVPHRFLHVLMQRAVHVAAGVPFGPERHALHLGGLVVPTEPL
jgi:hypothetical protein